MKGLILCLLLFSFAHNEEGQGLNHLIRGNAEQRPNYLRGNLGPLLPRS
jgi:hypothetical protein